MYLKCRHSGVYFLLFVISFPCRPSYYVAAQKTRRNADDYGERLSSVERGQRISNSGLNDVNRAPIKLSGVDHKYQEDAAQEEGMSLQDIPVVKLKLGNSSSKQELSKEDGGSQNGKLAQYTVGTAENTKEEEDHGDKQLKTEENSKEQGHEDKQLKTEENSKEQDHEDKQLKTEENSKEQDHEDKQLKTEENSKEQDHDEKTLKSEEKNVNRGEKGKDNGNDDFTVEIESSTVKQNDDTVTLDDGPSTKCTTDREVTIGNYTPQDSQSNDEGHSHGDDSGGGGDGGDGENKSSKGEDGHNDIDEETEKKVSKVYKGPKPAKAPDHYIDDV